MARAYTSSASRLNYRRSDDDDDDDAARFIEAAVLLLRCQYGGHRLMNKAAAPD